MPPPAFLRSLRADVIRSLPPADAERAAWSDARFPTLRDVDVLAGLVSHLGLSRTRLLSDDSAPTALERSDGNWESVMNRLAANPVLDVHARSAAFDQHVAPSTTAVSTRVKAWAGWRSVLTWATARGTLAAVLPMNMRTLKALLWDMLTAECSLAIIKGVIDGTQARHRRFNMPCPLSGPRAYSRLEHCLQRFQGRQRRLKLPVTRDMVVRCLRSDTLTAAGERNVLALAVGTTCCLRPSEGARLQACDLFYEFDLHRALAFRRTAALNVMKRKNDQARRGHHPRMGRARRRALDVVARLRSFMTRIGTVPGAGCTKAARPHARCPVCAPLFPMFTRTAGGAQVPSWQPTSPSAFSGMMSKALESTGHDATDFSGVCARRGGISTAIEAGVPESVLWLQSGHAADRSARSYVILSDPALLYLTWEAFRL